MESETCHAGLVSGLNLQLVKVPLGLFNSFRGRCPSFPLSIFPSAPGMCVHVGQRELWPGRCPAWRSVLHLRPYEERAVGSQSPDAVFSVLTENLQVP